MKQRKISFKSGFRVLAQNSRSQLAEMTLRPGGIEGGIDNNHAESDQWLIVCSGTGKAKVQGRTITLKTGTAILIEHGENHEIFNTGKENLKTVTVYVPPGYSRDGNPLPAAKPVKKRRQKAK